MTSNHSLDDLLATVLEARDRGEPIDVEALVTRHPQHATALRAFLEAESWVASTAAMLDPVLPDSDEYAAPPEIDGFRILREIARGGMGVVFEAEQAVPQRRVALKMLRDATLASDADRARFRREAQAAAELEHPGIIRILQVGTTAGRVWYTMPLAAGGNLAQALPAIVGDVPRAARLVRDVARAVAHGHARGILHRDLKPSNVLLDKRGSVLVTDFGLARREGAGHADQTRTGTVLGTPAYMPPEQARGDVRVIDERSDVWSLGVILYELLAGRPPFVGDGPAATLDLVLHAHVPPLRIVAPGTPRPLATICATCLQRANGDRYASMRDLADDLDRYLRGEPIHARPPPLMERAALWIRRRPGVLAVGAIGLLTAGLLGALVFASRDREEQARVHHAREHLARARALVREGDGVGAAWAYAAAHMLDPGFEAERGLLAHAPPVPRSIHPLHTKTIWRVRHDHAGRHLAAGTAGGVVHLWRLDGTGAPLSDSHRVLAHTPNVDVRGLAFGARDARLATGDEAGVLRVFSVAGGGLEASVGTRSGAAILALIWLDDRHVVAGDAEGYLHHWKVGAASATQHDLGVGSGTVTALLALPGEESVLVGRGGVGATARLYRWRRSGGALRVDGSEHAESVWDIARHGPAGPIATVDDAGLRTFGAVGAPPSPVVRHAAPVGAVAFGPRGAFLVTATVDGVVQAFDTRTGRALGRRMSHAAQVFGVAVHPTLGVISTGGLDGVLRIWNPPEARITQALMRGARPGGRGPVRCVPGADGRHVLACGLAADGTLEARLFDAEREAPVAAGRFALPAGSLAVFGRMGAEGWRGLSVAPEVGDGRSRLTSHRLAREGGRLVLSSGAGMVLEGTARTIGLAEDGGRAWVVTDRGVFFYGVDAKLDLTPGPTSPGRWRAWVSADGRWVAKAAEGRPQTLFIGPAERVGADADGHALPGIVARATVANDGNVVAATMADGKRVLLYDVKARRVRAVLRHGGVHHLAFTRDSRALVTAGAHPPLRVWSVSHGASLGAPVGFSLLVHPDGSLAQHFALGEREQVIHVATNRGEILHVDVSWLGAPGTAEALRRARMAAQLGAHRRLRADGSSEPLDTDGWRALRAEVGR